jgi:tetratricopeptide (TPR) repeat protein
MNRSYRLDLIICLILALSTVLVYWDIFSHQFVIIDDPVYVSRNPYVESGLTLQGVKWAFTTTKAEFWHPLTWLSYMLDTQMLGVRPASYLFTNLLLHVLNALLVFILFKRMTGAVWQSAFVAALFALHPLHVESVAWIAERKDVLSAFFWMLTTYFYFDYVERPGYKRYLTVCLFLTLGLTAKPMLVTLPFVLLLLDYWPLGRFKPERPLGTSIPSALFLIREKIPLFVLAAIFSLTAFLVQKTGGGISSTDQYSFMDRIYNAIISYTSYMWKMIWPHKLAVFYPFPDNFPIWKIGGATFLLIGITILALKSFRRYPFFIVGWLWYLGTLFPVIGLIKIGDFSLADRYTYIPLTGIFIIIAWGIPEISAKLSFKKLALGAAAAIAISGLAAISHFQVRLWSDSFSLFEHALQVTEKNFYAHYGLGHALAGQGKLDQAGSHFLKAVQMKPSKATLQNDLGRVLASQGKFNNAAIHFTKALEIKPQFPAAHFNLANVLVAKNQFNLAIYHFSEALRLHSDFAAGNGSTQNSSASGYHELVSMYDTNAKLNRVIEHNQKKLSANPHNLDALRILAILYSVKGDYDHALALLQIDKSAKGRVRDIFRGYTNWSLVKPR